MPYTVTATELPEVLILEPRVFGDDRGFFFESFNARDFRQATGLDVDFVQDNHSKSSRGVLRGLHYQISNPQGKLVRVTQGSVFDVAVDLRRDRALLGPELEHRPQQGAEDGEEVNDRPRRQNARKYAAGGIGGFEIEWLIRH